MLYTESYVNAIVISPCSTFFVTGENTGSIKVWDAKSKCLQRSSQHIHVVLALAISPDCKYLAAGCKEAGQNLKVWDLGNASEIWSLEAHRHHLGGLAFSPDGECLASGSWDQTIKLWDFRTMTVRKSIAEPSWSSSPFLFYCSLRFHPDEKSLVNGSHFGEAKVWDLETMTVRQTFRGCGICVRSFDLSPCGRFLVAGYGRGCPVELFDLVSGQQLQTIMDHHGGNVSVAFSPCGHFFVSGSHDDRTFQTHVNWWALGDEFPAKEYQDRAQYSGVSCEGVDSEVCASLTRG